MDGVDGDGGWWMQDTSHTEAGKITRITKMGVKAATLLTSNKPTAQSGFISDSPAHPN